MTVEPTLLLCVGATKAGTSWLYRHLRGHPECHLRAVKELHYFDMVEDGTYTRAIRRLRAAVEQAPHGARGPRLADVRALTGLAERRREAVDAYVSYLTEGAGGRRLVADITPAYALLPEGRLRQMAGIAPDVRFLYLMRDPLARLWSHVRMLAQRAAASAADLPGQARAILARVLAGGEPAVTRRGDYAGAVARLQAAVPPARLAVMVQEETLTVPGLAGLWAFLGIGPGPAELDRRVHAGIELAMDPSQAAAARDWLQPQYDFVRAMLGRMPQGWQDAKGLA